MKIQMEGFKMSITDITAIVAIILSLISLGIQIRKDFFKPKPSLKISIKDAKLRYKCSDKAVAQMIINMSITPLVKYNGIKEMFLENNKDGCLGEVGYLNIQESNVKIKWFYNLFTVDVFNKVNFDNFYEYVSDENKKRKAVEEIASNVDIPYKLTLMEQYTGTRWSDGYDDFPPDGFSLKIIDFYDNVYHLKLNFEIVIEVTDNGVRSQ